jgi:hypothetical protein
MLDLTQQLLADATIDRVDSCATAGHPMIDHIWRERLALADHLISLAPGAPFDFTIGCALEASRRSAIDLAKRMRDIMQRRLG